MSEEYDKAWAKKMKGWVDDGSPMVTRYGAPIITFGTDNEKKDEVFLAKDSGTTIFSVSADDCTIKAPEYSEWKCYLFGSTPENEMWSYRPKKNQEPNWFWRKMQYLILGNLWVKDDVR